MTTVTRKLRLSESSRAIKLVKKRANRSSQVRGRPVKTQKTKKVRTKESTPIEREYDTFFAPHPLPFRGLYAEQESLEQPSELIYVPATSAPTAGA